MQKEDKRPKVVKSFIPVFMLFNYYIMNAAFSIEEKKETICADAVPY